jgi:hypothetical protein
MSRTGRVVVLNGTASAGKTSLAAAIREHASGMWVAQDDFAANLIPGWVTVDGAFDGGNGGDAFRFVRDASGLPIASDASGRARTGSCSSGWHEDTTNWRTPTFATTSSST